MNNVVMMMKAFLCLCLLAVTGSRLRAADAKAVYENNFTAAAVGKVPDDMLVLDGGFAVQEEGGNKFLELPGAPLETYGVLFGPTEAAGLSIRASVQSTGKGRRFPTFAVGLNGVGGYKLQASPTKKLIELYKGEEVLTNAPLQWESGSWLLLRLQTRKVRTGRSGLKASAGSRATRSPRTGRSCAWKPARRLPAVLRCGACPSPERRSATMTCW